MRELSLAPEFFVQPLCVARRPCGSQFAGGLQQTDTASVLSYLLLLRDGAAFERDKRVESPAPQPQTYRVEPINRRPYRLDEQTCPGPDGRTGQLSSKMTGAKFE